MERELTKEEKEFYDIDKLADKLESRLDIDQARADSIMHIKEYIDLVKTYPPIPLDSLNEHFSVEPIHVFETTAHAILELMHWFVGTWDDVCVVTDIDSARWPPAVREPHEDFKP